MEDIDDLIAKALTGEASDAEKAELEQWIQSSRENRKYYDQLKTIFEKASLNITQLDIDTDEAWKKVEKNINRERATTIQLWPALKIAAGLIIILTSGIFTYRFFFPEVVRFTASTVINKMQSALPDSSLVFLNKRSAISYEYDKNQKTRKVKLKGEAFFEVKHNAEKPFVIEADEVLVKDIGTAFNMKAYPDKDTIEVDVQSGEVKFYTTKDPGLNLKAGERAFYSKRLHEFHRMVNADTNIFAYKTGMFTFGNTTLRSLINKINAVYDSKIRLSNDKLSACRITVNFNNDSLDTIVEVIAETLNLKVVRKGDEILLVGNGCQP